MAATLLTVAQLREHVETDLPDEALTRILDSEEGEIVARHGPHATAQTVLPGGGQWLVLERPAASISSIVERIYGVDYALDPTDYVLWPGGWLERWLYGMHYPRNRWGDLVTVTYVPVDATAQRTLVLVQLTKLALEYRGVKAEGIGSGDYQMTAHEYNAERDRLLRSLAPRRLVFA